MTRRSLAGLALIAFGLATALQSSPRVTWVNDGPSIGYGWAARLGALLPALGLMLLARGARAAAARLALGAAAAAAVLLGLHHSLFHLSASETGLARGGLGGTVRLAWRDVAHVETQAGAILLVGRSGERLRVATGPLQPGDRARLERTVARRVREASPAAGR